jgi:Protein of unknown function (DUF2007).
MAPIPPCEPAGAMVEVLRTTDPVLLSWLEMTFRERRIKAAVFDAYTSTVYGGALAAVPRRVMVAERDLARAEAILAEAEAMAGHD